MEEVTTTTTKTIKTQSMMNCFKHLFHYFFFQDCNKDGIVDCYDYFILHIWGLQQCNIKHKVIEREKIFDSCMRGLNSQ